MRKVVRAIDLVLKVMDALLTGMLRAIIVLYYLLKALFIVFIPSFALALIYGNFFYSSSSLLEPVEFLFVSVAVLGTIYISVNFLPPLWRHLKRKYMPEEQLQKRAQMANGGKYGTQLGRIEDTERVAKELLTLTPEHFKEKVVGQDLAIEEFIRGIKLGAKQLLRGNEKRKRVIASAIFVGLTGVGKTETAKTLAGLLEPLGYQFIRIDLNMYSSANSAWSLIGSPRGFIGSDEGGILTQALKRNPRAVILFDEMEKAHPNLHPVFMTLLDEGYVEDQSFGEKVYLNGAIIIFTSNLYAREINNLTKLERDPLSLELRIREYVERYFKRPEVVGRIDKIVPFRELREDDLVEIARRILVKYGKEDEAQELTRKLMSVANSYGVRMFVKKLEETVLLGEPPKPPERKSGGIEIVDI